VTIYDKGPPVTGTATVAFDGTWKLHADVGDGNIHSYIERSADLASNPGNSTGHTLYSANSQQSFVTTMTSSSRAPAIASREVRAPHLCVQFRLREGRGQGLWREQRRPGIRPYS